MNINRRTFLTASAIAVAAPRFTVSARANQDVVTSGGMGLTVADILSMYEEGPVGQSFRNFYEPQSGTTLYIDFGDDDLAQTIYVVGDVDPNNVDALIAWLVVDDVEDHRLFSAAATAGTLAWFNALTMSSRYLEEITGGRSRILATWTNEPDGSGGESVVGLMITLQQEGVG